MILTTMQAASIKINARDFRFPNYPEETRMIESKHAIIIEQNMAKSGFVADYVSSEHRFFIRTGRGGFPSFAPSGWLTIEDARKIFSK